jgi:SAM-dependent methyltransferase
LAPKCSVYRGTDLSMVAIGRLREFVASKPELRHVELVEREATSLDDQAPSSVDTVVINSVVQYFPDIHYLRTVLAEAARVVSSGGRIFIGDVRHLGLLPLFHGAVQFAKAPPSASARWLKRKVSLAVEQDRELVIDPQFFLDLTHSIPRISGVEILLKRGQAHNELTRYRYDVVLHVGETRSIPSRREEWRDVPNRRLASDIASVRRLWSADDRQLVGDIRRSLAAEIESGSDPEDFWKLSDTQPRRRLATDPLEVAFMQQLGLELTQLLSERLPQSRMPAAVLAVNELPSGEAATVPNSAVHFQKAASRQLVQG